MAYDSNFYNNFRNDLGKLSVDGPCRKAGKKAFDWSFTAAGSPEAVPVEVFLVAGEGGLHFKAVSKRLLKDVVDTDINRLRTTVEEALLDQAFAMTNIAWEDWLEVGVRGGSSKFDDSRYSAVGASLHIQVNRMKRGIHPETGLAMTINNNGVVVEFPKPTSATDPDLEEGQLRLGERPQERSYVPATAENLRAIDSIVSRMNMLRMSLSSLLSQETVQERLASLDTSGIPLLEGVVENQGTDRGRDERGEGQR